MKELRLPLNKKFKKPIVLGMGFFDCVHMGHRQLIKQILFMSKKLKAKSAITTFSNNPYKVFNHESKLIFTFSERLTLFKASGLDFCVPFKFDKYFKSVECDNFLKMLFDSLNIVGIVCGYDYLFGRGGKGNSAYLQEFCEKNNVAFEIIEPVVYDEERISSTLVKECLVRGDIEKANILLQNPYFMIGKVINGRGIGKEFGFPTANLSISKDKMLIKCGVYSSYTTVAGKRYSSLTSVGSKPTFNETALSIETFICGIKNDLYGQQIKVEFHKFLRDISKFDSAQDLRLQISKDLEESQKT